MILAEAKKLILRAISEPIELLLGIVILVAMFFLFRLGALSRMGGEINETQLLYPYVIWMSVANVFSLLNQETVRDIKNGLMEKIVVIGIKRFWSIYFARALFALMHTFVIITFSSILILLFISNVSVVAVIKLVLLSTPYGIAFGFFLSGFSLLTRQTLGLTIIFHGTVLGLLALFFGSSHLAGIAAYLPMAPIREIIQGFSYIEFLLNLMIYLGVSLLWIGFCLGLAKKIGSLDPHASV